MIQRVAQLCFDERPLLLDDEQRALAAGEITQPLGFQRPGQRDLVERDLRMAFEAQQPQRMQRVLVRLADRDQPDRRVARAGHQPVQTIGPRPGQHRRQPLIDHPAFEFGAVRGKPQLRVEIQPIRRHRMIRRDEPSPRPHRRGRRLLYRLRGGLQRDPQAGVARQRITGEAEIYNVLHRTGIQHGHENVLEQELGLVRIGGGMCAVVVARNRQHAAVPRRARHVRAMQRIAGAIDARPLRIPKPEGPIDMCAGECVELLRSHQHGGGQVLVDPRLEMDVMRRQQFGAAPEFLVQPAQGRAAVARHQRAGVQAGCAIQARLFQQQSHQGLDAGQQDRMVKIDKA